MKGRSTQFVVATLATTLAWGLCFAQQPGGPLSRDYYVTPVPFNQVHVQDGFWTARLETNRLVTIPYCFQKCEETGRIRNFEKAAGLRQGKHEGIYFDDSDVYKIMEGAAYSSRSIPTPCSACTSTSSSRSWPPPNGPTGICTRSTRFRTAA